MIECDWLFRAKSAPMVIARERQGHYSPVIGMPGHDPA